MGENGLTTTWLGATNWTIVALERFACGDWRRNDAGSTSLIRLVSRLGADARRDAGSRVVRAMVTGKDGAVTKVRRASVCTGVGYQNLSNEGGRSARLKTKQIQGGKEFRSREREKGVPNDR